MIKLYNSLFTTQYPEKRKRKNCSLKGDISEAIHFSVILQIVKVVTAVIQQNKWEQKLNIFADK